MSDHQPFFSIIIPLYNKESEIERAVDSVIRQSFKDFELVVVNDGSTDKSIERLAHYSESECKVIHQLNAGVSAARNRGVAESCGRFIVFLDADDEKSECYLEVVFSLIKQYPKAGIYGTAYQRKSVNGELSTCQIPGIPKAPWQGVMPDYFYSAAYGDPPLHTSSVTVPRVIFEEVGGFDHSARMGEDLELWGRIALNWPVVFSWYIGAIYYLDASNRAHDHESFYPPFVRLVDKKNMQGGILPHMDQNVREYCWKLLVNDASRALILSGKHEEPRRILREVQTSNKGLMRKKQILYCMTYLPGPLISILWRIRIWLSV